MAKAVKKEKAPKAATKFRWSFIYKCDKNLTVETCDSVEDSDIDAGINDAYDERFIKFWIGDVTYQVNLIELKLIVRSIVPVEDVPAAV